MHAGKINTNLYFFLQFPDLCDTINKCGNCKFQYLIVNLI